MPVQWGLFEWIREEFLRSFLFSALPVDVGNICEKSVTRKRA